MARWRCMPCVNMKREQGCTTIKRLKTRAGSQLCARYSVHTCKCLAPYTGMGTCSCRTASWLYSLANLAVSNWQLAISMSQKNRPDTEAAMATMSTPRTGMPIELDSSSYGWLSWGYMVVLQSSSGQFGAAHPRSSSSCLCLSLRMMLMLLMP